MTSRDFGYRCSDEEDDTIFPIPDEPKTPPPTEPPTPPVG